ncbi:MAG: RNA 3'-phosphate cyclase [Desulfomonile tiedjei]|nr:RNA 3'-phosphate cyclase [Desulfomonile tiedjei]
MIEIDGSLYSGSGTLLRYAVALATLTHRPLHMTHIRAKRPKAGLRAQHLHVITACGILSDGLIEGGAVGSQEILYRPGPAMRSGEFRVDIGTAGSATLAACALIPPSLFAEGPCRFSIVGGLFQDFAPSFFHMDRVLLPLLRSMGAKVKLQMVRPGYYPQGQGELILHVNPVSKPLNPVDLVQQGSVEFIRGVSLASHLRDQKVAWRMADTAQKIVTRREAALEIEILEDTRAVQRGAGLTIYAATDTGCILGSDRAGKLGRRAESIAEFAVETLFEDLDTGATVDRHVADQLILFAALAGGTSRYRVPAVTDHVKSNLWLVEKLLGASSHFEGPVLHIQGIGHPGT